MQVKAEQPDEGQVAYDPKENNLQYVIFLSNDDLTPEFLTYML